MGVPLRQSIRVGTYIARQKMSGRRKFPLNVELEPLFACNLECNGCGKIQYPTEVLRKRLTVEQAVAAIEECGAPMVSIAGGEPLLHPEIDKMAQALLDRKRFVYLCTNALLLERKLDRFHPHPGFSWVIHIDGLKDRHDASVSRDGVFDKAVAAIKAAKERGFRVATNTTFFNTDSPHTVREVLDFLNDELEVDTMMISPGYAYEKAPDQVHFLRVNESADLFKKAFEGKRKHWRLNHSPLFLDFLEGKVDFECTPWGVPSYSVFGWQRPCYLL
ncbi:MAG TPA: adenosyl-hopene transferase HpnH, partial [Acidimicrobiales bacterium]|nr:adenosyl-hopene transferase HpnH [Acidimicrobiales bacterium]